jgi:hypothetical protein
MNAAITRDALRAGLAASRPRDLLVGFAIGAACLLYMGAPLSPDGWRRDWTVPLVYNVLQFGLPLVPALRVADAAVDRGARPLAAYGAAVLAVVIAGVWLIAPLLLPLLGGDPGWTLVNDLWLATGIGVLLGFGTAGYARWRGTQRALARGRSAEAARAARERELQAARLLALQARIEPELLFDALGRVGRRLSAGDDAGADALLADTIAMLRALLPRAGGGASNLGRELALVQAQARVGGDTALQPPALQLDVDAAAARAVFAPTVLPALLRRLAGAHAGWTLRARCVDGRLQVAVRASPPDAVAEAALDAVDLPALIAPLRAVHGPSASVARARPATLQLDLPHADDPGADR